MKKYAIRVSYQTGDSFSNHDEVSTLELTWNNLDVAKANLKRIEEHYHWYEEINSMHYSYKKKEKRIEEPEWHKGIKEDFVLILKTDDNKDFRFGAFWCGYFETLYSAEITSTDDELKVNFRGY